MTSARQKNTPDTSGVKEEATTEATGTEKDTIEKDTAEKDAAAQAPSEKFTLLVVDDEPANIDILKDILMPHYQVKVATSGNLALQIVHKTPPDLILLDVMMPKMDGFEVCRQLKAAPAYQHIPVIFVTALGQGVDEVKGFQLGAVDYIAKPIMPTIVLARVKTHLALSQQMRTTERQVQARTHELMASQLSAISMLAEAGHFNDTDTGVHIWRMAAYTKRLAQAAQWSVEAASLLEQAAPMHDTGKIGIPDHILKAPRRLTDDEMEIMKTHARIGRDILSKSETPLFQLAAEVAYCHHEKWDGSGYPQGLSGEAIPESARIVAIADVFDALTMRRPYKQAWSVDAALDFIQTQAGTHFDPRLAAIFLNLKDEILQIKAYWDHQEADQDYAGLMMQERD